MPRLMLSRTGSVRVALVPVAAKSSRKRKAAFISSVPSSTPRSGPLVPVKSFLHGRRAGLARTGQTSQKSSGPVQRETGFETREEAKALRVDQYGSRRTTMASEKTFLEAASVGDPTQLDYLARMEGFSAWAKQCRLAMGTLAQTDEALVLYLNELFFEGFPSADASKVIAAVMFSRCWGRDATKLVRSKTAARGWNRLSPARSRLPIPWLAVVLIVMEMIQKAWLE